MVVSSQVLGFPCDSAGKESACNAGDLGSIPGLGRSPGEGKGYTPVVWPGKFRRLDSYGVTKSWTQLSNFHFTNSTLAFENLYLFFILIFLTPKTVCIGV